MATYLELHSLRNNRDLLSKVQTALYVIAFDIFNDVSPPANQPKRLQMANKIYESPESIAISVLPSILAANKGLTVAQIEGASDLAVQANVNSIINLFADNLV